MLHPMLSMPTILNIVADGLSDKYNNINSCQLRVLSSGTHIVEKPAKV